jgi:hypothetical protein
MKPEMVKTFIKIRWKIRIISFINWLIELYLYLSSIYIVSYFFRLDIRLDYLGIPLVLAAIFSVVKPIRDRDIAIILDKDLALEERVITTLEFDHQESPLVSNLIIDTVERLKNSNLKLVCRFRLRKRLLYAMGIPILIFFSLFIYNSIQFSRNLSLSEGVVASEKGKEIISLAQQLRSEKPEIAKRLEALGKGIEEKKVLQKENIATLDKITKEIDKETDSSGNTKNINVELKKILELTASKLDMENNPSKNNQEISPQRKESNQTAEDSNRGNEKGSSPKEPNTGQDNSSGILDKNNMPGIGKNGNTGSSEDKTTNPPSQAGSREDNGGIKDLGEASSKENNTIQEGGTLPGKGERENKLGEETQRKTEEGAPQFVPGIPKGEGEIKIEIKGFGKATSSNIPEAGGDVKKSAEDPLAKEPIPPEYREAIRLYFERLKGER